jgi:glycosyltransferase involved in cell wall biosynthesis
MVMGSGMKNKLLEAFALGVPVVSTSLGAESIEGVLDGKHLRICDDPGIIAETVMHLLDQPQQLAAMMGHAHELVRTRYTWDAVGRLWRQALNEAAERVSESML